MWSAGPRGAWPGCARSTARLVTHCGAEPGPSCGKGADEAGLGGEGRRRRGARLSRGRLPAGPPPGWPLDSLLGRAPTSGALGDRALLRVGPVLESNSQARRDRGVDSEHVRPGRAAPYPIFLTARFCGRRRRAPGPGPALCGDVIPRRPGVGRPAPGRSLPGGEKESTWALGGNRGLTSGPTTFLFSLSESANMSELRVSPLKQK